MNAVLAQHPTFKGLVLECDADGNQMLIKTETGVWSVVYNAENRPVRWESGDTVITMAFDRMGRRVEYHETRAGQVATHFRFVYDNFLCVQRLNVANGNAVRTEFVWDPTEPIATRPLVFLPASGETAYYFHDGNKNVSEVFYHALQDGIAAHYDYAPFGAVTRTARATRVTNRDLLSENPFRFSSEIHDDTLDLVYYNYRHYMPLAGRWTSRDILMESMSCNLYLFRTPFLPDFLGLRQAQATNTYADVYSIKWWKCKCEDGRFRWSIFNESEERVFYTETIFADLVWSKDNRLKALWDSIMNETKQKFGNLPQDIAEDMIIEELAKKYPGISSLGSLGAILDFLNSSKNVAIGTFVPPEGTQDLFHDGDYYRINGKVKKSDEIMPEGIDNLGNHIIPYSCTIEKEGDSYVTAQKEKTILINEGKWER